ncbi:hypothetical protein OROMI_029848 [Orobanche minor]
MVHFSREKVEGVDGGAPRYQVVPILPRNHSCFEKTKDDVIHVLPSEVGSSIGVATLAVSVNIPPGSSREGTFSLALIAVRLDLQVELHIIVCMQEVYIIYSVNGHAAARIASDAILEHAKWEHQIEVWQ